MLQSIFGRRSVLAMASVLALVSCATTGPSVATNYKGADAGKVVLAIGYQPGPDAPVYSDYKLYFGPAQSPTGQDRGSFAFVPAASESARRSGVISFERAGQHGAVLVASLKAGNYVISDYEVAAGRGAGRHAFGPSRRLRIPFEVRPGMVSYLGNFNAHGYIGRNALGQIVPAGVSWTVSQQRASDLALARGQVPDLPPAVLDQAPDAKSIGNPDFVDGGA